MEVLEVLMPCSCGVDCGLEISHPRLQRTQSFLEVITFNLMCLQTILLLGNNVLELFHGGAQLNDFLLRGRLGIV